MERAKRWASLAIAVLLALLIAGRSAAQEGGRLFDQTGQQLDNQHGFLDFWEQHDGAALLGAPITAIVLEANVPVQYFERARLEFRDGAVATGKLGLERTRWRSFPRVSATTARQGEQFFRETGHALGGAFLEFWYEHDGAVLFGPPISEPLWESVGGSNIRVQYFERARLEQRLAPGGEAIVVSALGQELALAKGLITPDQQPAAAIVEPIEPGDQGSAFAELAPPTPTPIPPTATPIPTARPLPPTPTAAPKQPATAAAQQPAPAKPAQAVPPVAPTAKPKPAIAAGGAGRVIDVNLSTQQLVAMEDGAVVYKTGVATGKDGFNTPTGTFSIYKKLKLRTMRGSAGGETWVVPNVPNVMYFTGAVALHGTYWHNQFGTGARLSHGCVNLSLKAAEWLYAWAPVGTEVVVHY